MFGICLGHQLLGLASGARTVKMKFGHHGANHPVQELAGGPRDHHEPEPRLRRRRGIAAATAQGDPPVAVRRHRCRASRCTDRPAFSFQGHPEASPGPHDLRPLFEHFVDLMVRRLQQQMRNRAAVATDDDLVAG